MSEVKRSDKELLTENRNRGVWLVKVPKFISDRWEGCNANDEVGRLKISKRSGSKPVVSFTLDDKIIQERSEDSSSNGGANGTEKKSGSTNKAIPKQHKFLVQNVDYLTLGVFSHVTGNAEENIPDRVSLEGRVVKRAECRPYSDAVYMNVKKDAIMKAIEPTRKTKQLDRAVNSYKPVSNHAANIAHEKRKKEEGKKSRDDKEKVMEKLFQLFEKHQYYNIKDLQRETRQPITHLKMILKEVCNYNLKNPHKNMWELKPEYRHYKNDDEGEDDPEGGKNGDESSDDSD